MQNERRPPEAWARALPRFGSLLALLLAPTCLGAAEPARKWTVYLAQDKHLDYNWCGSTTEIELRMAEPVRGSLKVPAGWSSVESCDALERPESRLDGTRAGRVEFTAVPREIRSLALSRDGSRTRR